MNCRHCGASVPDLAGTCVQCGQFPNGERVKKLKSSGSKVIPFRPRKPRKTRRSSPPPTRWVWWFGIILLISLIAPYLMPIH